MKEIYKGGKGIRNVKLWVNISFKYAINYYSESKTETKCNSRWQGRALIGKSYALSYDKKLISLQEKHVNFISHGVVVINGYTLE